MGLFDSTEKRIGQAVDKFFARAFKGDVQPVEISAAIQRDIDAEAKLLSRDRRLVPNNFTVYLSRHDYNRLYPYSKTLNSEITPYLREHAAERNYVFNGPIIISYEEDASLPTGQLRVNSEAVSSTDGAARSPRTHNRRLVLEVGGIRHPLLPPGLIIGRGSDADVRVNDPGVSRRHARIEVTGSQDQPHVTIEDMGSTNGISVNGARVQHARLTDGSRIEIGNTRMLVHSPSEF